MPFTEQMPLVGMVLFEKYVMCLIVCLTAISIEQYVPDVMPPNEFSNIVSVSWTDHLVFGEAEGRLSTMAALKQRMKKWKTELGARIILWRCTRDRIKGRYFTAKGYRHFFKAGKPKIVWNDFHVVPELAHDFGLIAFLYVSLFDEGWPLAPKKERLVSYHNRMHCQHVSWQSNFSRKNPHFSMVSRSGDQHQWGVLCLAYAEVRNHFIQRYLRLIDSGDFDGLFVCLRSQSKPAAFADQYGFNEPVRKDYLDRYGRDIRKQDFDLAAWRSLLGEYITRFFVELRNALGYKKKFLAVGVPRGNILGPPFGNTTLQWQTWIKEGLVDYLVIEQNSSQCPSMWHQLWPMHRGYGYLHNYLDGFGMKSLEEDLSQTYEKALKKGAVKLYLSRQWHKRSRKIEKALIQHPSVQGLVFSSFRNDNPKALMRNDWSH
jgi:hypothetical protein